MRIVPLVPASSVLAAALILAFPASAGAADRGREAKPARLDAVVVTATREAQHALVVPAAVNRIDGDTIRRARPRVHLSESLQRIPGVAARDRQNLAQDVQISIRGFGARATFGVRGVRLYTDGIPATMPDGQGQVSHFSLDAAGAIEVLRGPFSALYGNSSGGVIQIFTAPPPARPEMDFGTSVGSDGSWRTSVSAADGWRTARGGYRLNASRFATDGFRDHSAAQREGAQAFLQGEFAGSEWNLIANSVDIEADDPQGLTAFELGRGRRAASPGAVSFNTRKRVRQQQMGASVDRELSDALGFRLTAHGGRRTTVQFLSVPLASQRNPLSGGGVIDLDRDYSGLDARLLVHREWRGRPLTLAAGMELQSSSEDRSGFENFVGSTLGVRGLLRRSERNRVRGFDQFLQAEWDPSPRWRVFAGARRSQVEFRSRDRFVTSGNPDDSGGLRYTEVTPVTGVLFRATPTVSLYANLGQGFETPTFNELGYRSDGSSGLNTSLSAARSDNAEMGLRAHTERNTLDVTIFQSRTEGELAVASNLGGRSTFANAGESRRQGIELASSGTLDRHWRYTVAYTALDARYRDGFSLCTSAPCVRPDVAVRAGTRIPGFAKHFGFAEIVFAPNESMDVALAGRFSGRVFADDSNTAFAPGFASFDLSATRGWQFGALRMEAFARIDNLLDRDITGSVIVNESNGRYFEPSPGRNWLLGVDATIAFQ